MKHIVTIIGARPQFIKAAVLSRLIRTKKWKEKFKETIIHTGQHYDENMSNIFFKELDIPHPDIHLNIVSNTHGEMTGRMLIQTESELIRLKPDLINVYGDTNSTLAGALAAAKLNIPIAHIEAGLRSFSRNMPEEQNRIITDHLSTWLFCPTKTAIKNLQRENINQNIYNVGDIMLDASLFYSKIISDEKSSGLSRIKWIKSLQVAIENGNYALATIHRAENTDNVDSITSIIDALNELKTIIILPLHPRTKKIINRLGIKLHSNIIVIDPIGYFEMLELEMNCSCIITDSGGIQKEAYFLQKPCITLRDQTEWIETIDSGWNILVGSNKDKIINAFSLVKSGQKQTKCLFGKGNTGQRIL